MDNSLIPVPFNKEYTKHRLTNFTKSFFHNWLCPDGFVCWHGKRENFVFGHFNDLFLPNTKQEEKAYNDIFANLSFEDECTELFGNSYNSFVKSSENKIRGENTYNCMIDDRMDFSIDKYRVIVKGRSVGSTYESVKHFLKQHPEYIKE
jgi:hypothetical protein